MTALSRPSLRSSARKNPDLESPATDIHLPRTRQGKRTRESSLDNKSSASSKKPKNENAEHTPSKSLSKKKLPRSLPFRDKPVTKDAQTQVVRSRKPNPELPHGTSNTATLHAPPPITVNGASSGPVQPLAQVDKRSLRSHDGGSRSKSELSLYFPNYDELVSIEPKKPELLTPDTILQITDEPTKSTNANPTSFSGRKSNQKGKGTTANGSSQTIQWSEEVFTTFNNATRIELPSLEKRYARQNAKDPLDDSYYLKVHRRAERQEKQLRNIEKERAMHEKVQLERLLDGLKGHDWLRVMGISGITDGEKKSFEPKRDHLIGEVRILLEKFRLWKEEEKRRKAEKETAEDEEEEDDEEEDDEEEGEEEGDEDEQGGNDEEEEDEVERDEEGGGESDGDPIDYTDVDASAARQLHMEAISATQPPPTPRPRKPHPHQAQPKSEPAAKPFTSFFPKPYMRDAAIGKHRRGRTRFAFGQPVPDPEEQAFELPSDILTDDAIATRERARRRVKRTGKD